MPNVTLWSASVGSHLWGMNRPDSDQDLFECYVVPTEDILSGRNHGGGAHFTPRTLENNVDLQSHEVGRWVEQLLKMNPNYLFGLFSPLVVEDRGYYRSDLQALIEDGLSKQVYNPVVGLILSNRKKYVESGVDPSPRRIAKLLRVGMWGLEVLSGNGPRLFNPFPEAEATTMKVDVMLRLLDHAYAESPLPDEVPRAIEEKVRAWLLKVRLRKLKGVL